MTDIFSNRHIAEEHPAKFQKVEEFKGQQCSVKDYPAKCPMQDDHQRQGHPAIRIRAQSVSAKRGRQKNKQPIQGCQPETNHDDSSTRIRSSSVSNKLFLMTSHGDSMTEVLHMNKRLSFPVHSRSSSLSCYFSSASSSSTSSEDSTTTESPEQFWNRYRRKSRRPSLGQLVKQALSPKRKDERHPSSPPHRRKDLEHIKIESESEYSEIYGEQLQ